VQKGDAERCSRSLSRTVSWLLISERLSRDRSTRNSRHQPASVVYSPIPVTRARASGAQQWEVFELYSGALVNQAWAIVHTENERLSLIPWCTTLTANHCSWTAHATIYLTTHVCCLLPDVSVTSDGVGNPSAIKSLKNRVFYMLSSPQPSTLFGLSICTRLLHTSYRSPIFIPLNRTFIPMPLFWSVDVVKIGADAVDAVISHTPATGALTRSLWRHRRHVRCHRQCPGPFTLHSHTRIFLTSPYGWPTRSQSQASVTRWYL